MTGPMLVVRDLRTSFRTSGGVVKAVDGVSFGIDRGEVVGVVGESGSGKSVMAMSLIGLVPEPGRIDSGRVLWKGRDLVRVPQREVRSLRGREIAVVFQDPMSSLNPVQTVGRQIAEAVLLHRRVPRQAAMDRAADAMAAVGIPSPRRHLASYPHEFSGGMRQRVMIAMALVNEPDLIIADEPTTALDVTIQAQVMSVLDEIRQRTGTAILLITHDLGLVAAMADRLLVMYAGRVVEEGATSEVFGRARHPYTLGLLASLPRADRPAGERLRPIAGNPPSLVAVPPGCAFHPRCPYARTPAPCATDEPVLDGWPGGDSRVRHGAACHFADEIATGAGLAPAHGGDR